MNNHNRQMFLIRALATVFLVSLFLSIFGFLVLPWVYASQNTSPLFVDILIMSILFAIVAFVFLIATLVESDS